MHVRSENACLIRVEILHKTKTISEPNCTELFYLGPKWEETDTGINEPHTVFIKCRDIEQNCCELAKKHAKTKAVKVKRARKEVLMIIHNVV